MPPLAMMQKGSVFGANMLSKSYPIQTYNTFTNYLISTRQLNLKINNTCKSQTTALKHHCVHVITKTADVFTSFHLYGICPVRLRGLCTASYRRLSGAHRAIRTLCC